MPSHSRPFVSATSKVLIEKSRASRRVETVTSPPPPPSATRDSQTGVARPSRSRETDPDIIGKVIDTNRTNRLAARYKSASLFLQV